MTDLEELDWENEGGNGLTRSAPEDPPEDHEDHEDQKVLVGFHPFGGVRLVSPDVRLEPNEAFVLAGQLIAHATMVINFGYMAQAQEAEELNRLARSIQLPPGAK